MGKVLCLINSKGGVTKTTSTYNIAAVLSAKGKKVLMVDLDAQASLTLSAGYNPLDFEINMVQVFEDANKIAEAIYDTDIERLSILPSHPLLASVELNLINARNREKKLDKALKLVEPLFDYIVLDCPPQLSMVTLNALTGTNFVIVPCETSQLSYYALDSLIETVEGVKEDLNEKIEILGIIATLFDCRAKTTDVEVLKIMKENYEVLGTIKRMNSAKKGLAKGLPVVISEPKSPIAIEYNAIVDRILEKVEGNK